MNKIIPTNRKWTKKKLFNFLHNAEKNVEEYLSNNHMKGGKKIMETNTNAVQGVDPELMNVEVRQSAPQFDPSQYEGRRVKIASVKKIEKDTYWKDGERISTPIKIPAVEIETEEIGQLPQSDGSSRPLTVTARLNLKEIINEDGSKTVVVSKHEKSRLWKLMRKCGANTIPELVGKFVTLTTEPSASPDDDRVWLRISI